MRGFLKAVLTMNVNKYKIENDVTKLYCKLIMDGSTHVQATNKVQNILNIMQDELESIKGDKA